MVSNLGVFDFETPDQVMRLRSVHPGVTVDEIVEATGFELVVPSDVPETRLPTPEELELIRTVLDPRGLRDREVTAVTAIRHDPALHTRVLPSWSASGTRSCRPAWAGWPAPGWWRPPPRPGDWASWPRPP